jgi:hypothetical protein
MLSHLIDDVGIGLYSYFGLDSMIWTSENLSLSSDFSDIVLRRTLLLFTLASSDVSRVNTFFFVRVSGLKDDV